MASNPELEVDTETQRTPAQEAARWRVELEAAKKAQEKWRQIGRDVVARYLDERPETNAINETRWNVFAANVDVLRSMLYGKPPKVSATRRFADPDDDEARVAGEMLERILNTDIEADGDGFSLALQHALEDRLIPGIGIVRVRYECEMATMPGASAQMGKCRACYGSGAVSSLGYCAACGNSGQTELAPAVPDIERKCSEEVATDYVHWQDFLWSPARRWDEIRWLAFRAELSRAEGTKRFGNIFRSVPLVAGKGQDAKQEDPRDRAEVWEIWDRESRRVYWVASGVSLLLDAKDDPLGLDGFFPCPRPMIARATTSNFAPRCDYVMAEDLYREIDTVSSRITRLEQAIRVIGVYDKSAGELKQMLDPRRSDNQMLPVDNWAMFAEKGGVKGIVDWLPLEQIVNALTALRGYRVELMDALYQMTGMSDIMRGQATSSGVTATEQSIKARFGSVRVQALQDEFARFATDVQALKAEVMAKHYDAETYIQQSNISRTPDAQYAQAAVVMLKDPEASWRWRVEVKPEAISLTDFAQQKNERLEILAGISGFMQSIAPLVQQLPNALPFVLQLLQWILSGMRGASEAEGILDAAIAAAQQQAQQAAPPPPPDPKLLVQQLKGQQDLARTQADLDADLIREQAGVQADHQRELNQASANVKEAMDKARIQAMFHPPPANGGFR